MSNKITYIGCAMSLLPTLAVVAYLSKQTEAIAQTQAKDTDLNFAIWHTHYGSR